MSSIATVFGFALLAIVAILLVATFVEVFADRDDDDSDQPLFV